MPASQPRLLKAARPSARPLAGGNFARCLLLMSGFACHSCGWGRSLLAGAGRPRVRPPRSATGLRRRAASGGGRAAGDASAAAAAAARRSLLGAIGAYWEPPQPAQRSDAAARSHRANWTHHRRHRKSPAFVRPFARQSGPDAEGWSRVLMHPGKLQVVRSACRLGVGIRWSEVRRMALAATTAGGGLCARALFERSGDRTPLCMLSDAESIHAAYAALLTDSMISVQYRCVQVDEGGGDGVMADSEANMMALQSRLYAPRRLAASFMAAGPTSALLGRHPQPGSSTLQLAIVDPLIVGRRGKIKPYWQKAWAFALRMMECEEFPPVRISWCAGGFDGWTYSDGCHRYFASLVSGTWLRICFKPPSGRL
ncbi:unnamed protein product, partial [Prorocentrum cordatum]